MGEKTTEEVAKAKSTRFVCDGCGGVLQFDIKKQQFLCSSCKAPKDMEMLSGEVKENDFSHYHAREAAGDEFPGLTSIICQNCGAETIFDAYDTATVCPMCKAPKIFAEKQITGVPPDGLIPFQIDRQDAAQCFHKWIRGLWFAPNRLKKAYSEGELRGVYLPFWTYDAQAFASDTGSGGERYTTKDSDGNTQTETRWYPVSGSVSNFFNDVQICASDLESKALSDKILPFDTIHKTRKYSPEYLSGFFAERYQVKADRGFEEAKDWMEGQLEDMAHSDILSRGYDVAQVNSLDAIYEDVTYKQVLLPVWVSSFSYSGKLYQYAINGETGEVGGQRPYSIPKIVACIILVTAIIGGLVYYFDIYEGSQMPDDEVVLVVSEEEYGLDLPTWFIG